MADLPVSCDLVELPCNLCGSADARVRFHAPADGSDAGRKDYEATTDRFGAYGTVKQCRRCGLVYTSPRLRGELILGEYERTTDDEYATEAESRSINAYFCLATIRRHAKGGRLLDVGCSSGFFLNAARLAYEVVGVEPSRTASSYATDQLGLHLPATTLEAAGFPDQHFDVVTLIDVIEHVDDPLSTMREVARITRSGGIVYLVTPNIESLSARVLRSRWWGLRPAHIYYFSRTTLKELLNKAGYEVIEATSYGRVFTWGYWLSRLRTYPAPLYRLVNAGIRMFGLSNKFLYLDTRDSMQVIARRRS